MTIKATRLAIMTGLASPHPCAGKISVATFVFAPNTQAKESDMGTKLKTTVIAATTLAALFLPAVAEAGFRYVP